MLTPDDAILIADALAIISPDNEGAAERAARLSEYFRDIAETGQRFKVKLERE